jgi:BirA family biotin operon repressor/biotin-[acetyl-CoA-carboxylase] ligase
MQQIKAGFVQHGTTWFAHAQTAGRGQRGKEWLTATGENIIISIAVATKQLVLSQQFAFSAAIALGCHDFFSHYALADDTRIKWPNDIYWRDRKAAGILIENVIQGEDWHWAVVGIGMNVNQTKFADGIHAVSLKQITGKTYEVPVLAKALCVAIEKRWQILLAGQEVLADYNRVLYKRQEIVKLKKDNIVFEACIEQVTAIGSLRVSGALYDELAFGTVQWLITG